MYNIYIISRSDVDYTTYQLSDFITSKSIIKTKDRYEFKLRMNLMGINSNSFKIVRYSIFKNCVGGYTASMIMTKRKRLF